MTVTSPFWLTAMFATVAFYWLFPAALRPKFLTVATACFLLYADYRAAVLLAIFVASSWMLLKLRPKHSVLIALAIPCLALVYYKLQMNAGPVSTFGGVAIPLGLSYSTFRILHYVIESSRNNLPEHKFADYLAYIFFLPTILVGPINRFPQFLNDRLSSLWRSEHISGGLERIVIGYFKITVIATYLLSKVSSQWLANTYADSSPFGHYLEAVIGSLNLYMLFSGYSDIAIGFAMMLGYTVMENFRFPFLQKNIADFWRCWHISLTSWSREYVFMTALSLTRKPYLATLLSLLFIGIWHEISFRYVAWGLYHGMGIVVCMQWGKFKRKANLPSPQSATLVMAANTLKVFMTANFFFLGYFIAPGVSGMVPQ
ncbi:MAG: alginate O-acetyltransferase complex protein AlgI [Halioglobus sp.]|jgi:alginate O-acetyltransferase complex protein AlgI